MWEVIKINKLQEWCSVPYYTSIYEIIQISISTATTCGTEQLIDLLLIFIDSLRHTFLYLFLPLTAGLFAVAVQWSDFKLHHLDSGAHL